MCKLLWCVAQKKDKIWVKWIHEYYIKDQDMLTMSIPGQCYWVITKILQARNTLVESSLGAAGLGQNYFSVMKLYIDMRGDCAKVDWHRLLIDNVAPPKCQFIMWLAMLDRMVTCEYMRRFGFQGDDLCCLCEQEAETMEHLFFLCPYSATVWREVAAWGKLDVQPKGWSEEKVQLIAKCQTKTGMQRMYRLLATVSLYQIWCERNRRRFQDIKVTADVLVRQCQTLAAVRCRVDPKLVRIVQNL